MPSAVISAGRRALAALVLMLAVLAAVDAALFKVWHPFYVSALPPKSFDCSLAYSCYSTRPGWAIPVAIVSGLVGMFVAALLYRPRPIGLVAALRYRPRPHL
jgi:hypothetical protein